ncbi:hypothetical protein PFISCL1PPCAC_7398, partial [Pristionchus fissidentatus]
DIYEIFNAKFPEALKNFEKAALKIDQSENVGGKRRRVEEEGRSEADRAEWIKMERIRGENVQLRNQVEGLQKTIQTLRTMTSESEHKSRFKEEFEELQELDEGSYGKVYAVRNNLDKRQYAIKKIIIRESNEEKILKEVHALANFEHPNIVRYYASWKEKIHGNYYLFIQMQKCDYSLKTWLSDHQLKTRDYERIRVIFKQIVEAVAYI